MIGGAEAALAALDVDDRAERAFERTTAPEVEARNTQEVLVDFALLQQWNRFARQIGRMGEVVVDRLQRTGKTVAQHFVDPTLFAFPCEETDAQVLRLDEIGRQRLQHREASGDVEAADADRNAGRAKRSRHVHRARKLVGLHADQKNEGLAGSRGGYDPRDVDLGVYLVDVGHADIAEVLQDAAFY